MAGKVKTWVWVVVGLFVLGILFLIAVAATGFFVFRQTIDTQTVTAANAAAEFETVRSRFASQRALIELDENGEFLRANTDRKPPPDVRRPETLVVMAHDPDDGGLVRVRLPFWLLRMNPESGTINFGRNSVNLEDLKLTVRDLERYGPSLVLDQKSRGGDRVLVWTE